MIVGIDGTRSRSGGAIGYLSNIFNHRDPRPFGISKVHLWADKKVLDQIPPKSWLIPHDIGPYSQSLVREVLWQKTKLANELESNQCDVLFIPNGVSVCNYSPQIAMCRDLLCFEPGQRDLYPLFSKQQLRLRINKWLQRNTYRKADRVIFLNNYARDLVGEHLDRDVGDSPIIAHGVDTQVFFPDTQNRTLPVSPIKMTYVSNLDAYKHQWNVIEGIAAARKKGAMIELTLVGKMLGPLRAKLEAAICQFDPTREWVRVAGQKSPKDVSDILRRSDCFIYASSCENLPNSLIEAIATGLPILSSDKGPMPTMLGDTAFYFDPYKPASIQSAVIRASQNQREFLKLGEASYLLSKNYRWEKSSEKLWEVLASTVTKN